MQGVHFETKTKQVKYYVRLLCCGETVKINVSTHGLNIYQIVLKSVTLYLSSSFYLQKLQLIGTETII